MQKKDASKKNEISRPSEEEQAKERISKLRKFIDYHRTLYHTFDTPLLSDEAFDTLKNELEELEYKFPNLVTATSPTQTVGGKPLDKFVKVKHESPMLSFDDAFSVTEMEEWLKRLENYLGKPLTVADSTPTNAKKNLHKSASLFYCELKLDGLAIELIYDNGELVLGATRGDGFVGEDVTQNVKTISAIPQTLSQFGPWKIPKHLIIRGEILVSKKELERINNEQEKKGLKKFANVRNLAAGSIRQLDPKVAASRKLESFQYDIVLGQNPIGKPSIFNGARTHEEEHKMLASWGFTINPYNRPAKDLKEVLAFRDYWEKHREGLDYDIDGIVAIINDNSIFDSAGVIGKAPRAAIAYKFSPRQASTIVEDVFVQVGRTGILTPVALLRAVDVGGTTITHSTLHNFDEIKRLGLKIGDTVIVTRAGDVIPKITHVYKELRTGKEKEIKIPKKCPVDGSPVKRDGVFAKCSNPKCGAVNRNLIIHFATRDAFDIRGLGEGVVDRFLDEGLIVGPADIFTLQKGDIAALERFGEKSAQNIIGQIEKSKKISLDRFIYALGIPNVGRETAIALAKKFMSSGKGVLINNLENYYKNISIEELESISDIGPKVSQGIKEWFRDKFDDALLKKLEAGGVKLIGFKEKAGGIFSGLRICLTGSLLSMSRPRAKEIIVSEGGHFDSDVNLKTDVLIVGNEPGSKLEKARKLGIEIWDEKMFLNKIK
jgi:DNA ligase (NAD+)